MKQNSHHVFDQQFTELFKNRIETRIIKKHFKNEKECRDIYQLQPGLYPILIPWCVGDRHGNL